jgi:hypothetical protein
MLGVRVEKIVLVNGDAPAVSLKGCMFLMAIGESSVCSKTVLLNSIR